MRLKPALHSGPQLVRGKVPKPARLPRASIFVIDSGSTPLESDGFIERIRAESPQSRIIVVKETANDERVFPYLRLGARGIVRYADAENDLAKAVTAVTNGDFWLDAKQLYRFVDWLLAMPAHRGALYESRLLSRREREVLVSLLSGVTNKEIASALNISERTVKFHVSHLLQKLGAHRRSDLIAKQHSLWSAIS